MLKNLKKQGDPVKEILSYWVPELISAAILISVPPLIDSYFVANLKSTTIYGALGLATSFIHLLTKLAEGIPVAAMAIVGRHNGAKEFEKCGEDLGDAFWTTTLIGLFFFLAVLFGASPIFQWLGVPTKMINVGIPYLKLRAVGVFLVFTLMGFFGFMRGVKNTKTPMIINLTGVATFVVFDYALVLGQLGFPQLKLIGSAIATIIQYSVMLAMAIFFTIYSPEHKKYFVKIFFKHFNIHRALRLLRLSLPIMIDKSSLAFSYLWLSKMITPMGKYAIATCDIVNKLERFAILPAVGFAQVITFLVSNRLGASDPEGAKANIKKVMLLTAVIVSLALITLSLNAGFFVKLFDQKQKYLLFASKSLMIISTLVIFDFVQLILAGALRGAGDVKAVMKIRFFVSFLFFVPFSFLMQKLPIQNEVIKFVCIYGSFYLSTGIMGIFFLKRIRGPKWKKEI